MNRLHFAAACVSFTCITFILASCMEELENTDKIGNVAFEPEIGFPLVNSTFTMEEFLTEGGSKARISEQSGVMVLTYDDSIFTPGAETIFTIPDQQSPVISITGPEVTFPSPGSSVTVSKSITFAFNPSPGDNLDSILIKARCCSRLRKLSRPISTSLFRFPHWNSREWASSRILRLPGPEH